MCLVCWQLPTIEHWTEDRDVHASGTGHAGSPTARNRQRERLLRAQVLTQILEYYGLRVEDWVGALYKLVDSKGSTVLIQNLGELWPAAEKLAGRRIDPLDPHLVDALQHNQQVE